MRHIKIGLLVLASAFCLGAAPITPFPFDPIDDIDDEEINLKISTDTYYGPFDGENNQLVKFNVSGFTSIYSILVEYRYNDAGESKYGEASGRLNTLLNGNKYFYLNLELKNRMKSAGVNITFSFLVDDEIKLSFKVVLYPTSNEIIHSYNYRNKDYTISNRVFKITNNVVYYDEKVNFIDTIDYITNSRSNYLDFSEISFAYKSIFDWDDNVDSYLVIKDIDNIFPYLIKDIKHEVRFPLIAKRENDAITFMNNDFYFYSPTTYEIARNRDKEHDIKIITDKIYINPTKYSLLENANIYIYCSNLLKSGPSVKIYLQFLKDRNFIGYCTNSNYCIEGGIRE